MTIDEIRQQWRPGTTLRFKRPRQNGRYQFSKSGRLSQTNMEGRDTRLTIFAEDFARSDFTVCK